MVCPRRDAGNTFFVHEGPRRATKNCNGNTFVHGGHGGPRRTATATATSFCPRRASKEHEERQRQHICPRRDTEGRGELQRRLQLHFVHGGPRRNTKNCNGNTFVHGGTRRAAENCNGDCNFLLSTKGREGPRRTATATHLSTEDTEGRGELQRQHICPRRTRRAAENCNGDCNFILSTKGREGTRRTATATHLSTEDAEGRGELQRRLQLPFVHAKNCNGNTSMEDGGPRENLCQIIIWSVHEGTRGTATKETKNCNGRRQRLPFVHGGPRRATKNCNGNTFVHGGHGGPRRTATATATSFCPRRAAKGHEENHCKVIIWSVQEGTRGTPYVVDADHGRRSRRIRRETV